jgi:hypothetical protein
MKTIELKGTTYVIGKLDAMKQFHVTRRLAPLLAAAGESASQVKDLEVDGIFMRMAMAVTTGLASMKDEDAEFIIGTCCDAVQRQVGDKRIAIRAGGRFFDDIDMMTMMRLTSEVVQENCGDFFAQLIGALGLPISAGTPDEAAPQPQ